MQAYRHSAKQTLGENDAVVRALVDALVQACSTDDALTALRCLRVTPPVLRTAARAFGAKGSAKGVAAAEAMAVQRGLLRDHSHPDVFFALIQAYGALGRLSDVRRLFHDARAAGAWRGGPEDCRRTAVLLHALHSDVKLVFVRAKQLLDGGVAFETACFNVLLKSCMRAGDAKRARLAMAWMADADVQPDDITWASLIKALSYAGDFEGVLGVRREMAERGVAPTTGCWGSLLVACGAAQQPETALMLWRELKAEYGGGHAVPPNVYNAMLTACNTARYAERSLGLLEEMKAAGVAPGVKTYNLAIKACEGRPGQRPRHDQLVTALALYAEMQAAGLRADEFTYGTLLEVCAEGQQGHVAAQLRDRMLEEGIKPNAVVWTSLIKALARAGLVDDALAAFGKMVWGPARLKPNRRTFRTLVRELREQGALVEALRVYAGMRAAQFAPNNRDFQELIAAAAESALAYGDPELQAQLAALCKITSLTQLDLHGMSTHEARAAVLCVLSMLVSQFQRTAEGPAPLIIITGKGGHSEGGKAVLPSTVRRLLSEELHIPLPPAPEEQLDGEGGIAAVAAGSEEPALEWFDGSANGSPARSPARTTPAGANPGRIVIESESLEKWLRARGAARQQSYR